MAEYQCFQVATDERGVRTAILDVPDRPVNVFDDTVLRELNEIVDDAAHAAHPPVRCLIFRSGKASGFLAGADIHRLQHIDSEGEAHWILEQGQQLFNKIEQLAIPTIAVIHGVCMGGGLEFALACRHRLAVDDPATKLALPEVKLGLIPAWGGTQRLPKRVPLTVALSMLLEGKALTARKALRAGLVDAAVAADQLESELERFAQSRLTGSAQPVAKRSWLDWVLTETPPGRALAFSKARQSIAQPSRQYPALPQILQAAELSVQTAGRPTDAGLKFERDAFVRLLFGTPAQSLIGLFLNQERAKKIATWTNASSDLRINKVVVLGAGAMGAGIAQACLSRGLEVVLQDIQDEFIARGRRSIEQLFRKAVTKGGMPEAEAIAALGRLHLRTRWEASHDIDLMIEAVVENPQIKAEVFASADRALPPPALLTSNTSALPIDALARTTQRPEQTAGLHFFNPVHKMPLVEVVRSELTSEETIASLVQLVKKLGKTPIVVRQSPGFLVNRILFPYLDEAARMALEGYSVRDIDREAEKFGMPMGPLELLDVVGLDVASDVSRTLTPLAGEPTPAPALFLAMVENNFKGQKTGRGFYHWKEGKRGEPAGLPADLPATPGEPLPDWVVGDEALGTIQQRLVLAMLNEAQKCLNEQIVNDAWMVDLGMVLGTGFAPFRGGPMACIARWSPEAVQARLQLLTEKLGPRFTPAVGQASVLASMEHH